jgi:CBS domain-containing protein
MNTLNTMIDASHLEIPIRVVQNATLREAASAMEDSRSSCVLVGVSPSWLVTEHDLVGALAAGLDAGAPVDQIVTKAPVWATNSTTLLDAVDTMLHHGIRHLLVLSATGEPMGVLSLATATRLLLDTPMTRPADKRD